MIMALASSLKSNIFIMFPVPVFLVISCGYGAFEMLNVSYLLNAYKLLLKIFPKERCNAPVEKKMSAVAATSATNPVQCK